VKCFGGNQMNSVISLKKYVYKYISQKIQDGTLAPNQKINEQQICDELQVSRTPVREALIQLSCEGLLVNEPRKGFRVKPMTLEDAKNIYIIIGTLDALAASLATNNMSKEDLDKMDKLVEDMEDAINNNQYSDYYRLQLEFHNTYLDKCNNNELIDMLNLLKMRFLRQDYSPESDENLFETLREANSHHRTIIELFKDKKSKELEQFLKEIHWDIEYAALDVF